MSDDGDDAGSMRSRSRSPLSTLHASSATEIAPPPSEDTNGGLQVEMSETGDDEVDDGFITVVAKMNRRSGIPVVLRPVNPDASFLHINPNVIASEVMMATQEHIKSHRISRDGSLTITVASASAARALLAIKSLANVMVSTRVPESYAKNVGKITGVRTPYTDAQLLEYLKSAGAVDVRRQRAYNIDESGATKVRQFNSVIITFRSDQPMPEEVTLGFNVYKVREFLSPIQCYKCLRFGHMAKTCRGNQKCKICAGAHSHKDCTCRRERRCANCNSPHAATYGGCPCRRAAVEVLRQLAYEDMQVQTKAPRPKQLRSSPRDFPPLPPPLQTRKAAAAGLTRPTSLPPQNNPPPPPKERAWTQDTAIPAVFEPCPIPPPIPPRKNFPVTSSKSSQGDLVIHMVPFLFAALKAVVAALPHAKDLPEVKHVLAFEPMMYKTLACFQYE